MSFFDYFFKNTFAFRTWLMYETYIAHVRMVHGPYTKSKQ